MTIRELGPHDDLGMLLDLSRRAFGPISLADRGRWQADAEPAIRDHRWLGAFDGSRLVAAARYHDMVQWWQGRCLPMAGVASVMVAPEDRGRGTGRALMTACSASSPSGDTRCPCSIRRRWPSTGHWAGRSPAARTRW